MARPAAEAIYAALLGAYGPQGWWPLLAVRGANPTASGSLRGYHPGDYSYPHDDAQRFEIAVGAVLTQNTAWPNVERALQALQARGAIDPAALLDLDDDALETAIRPSGYYRVKARKLRDLAVFWQRLGGRTPGRDELLGVWGIGPETADSIRLYAFGQKEMVVDAYTRRILGALGLLAERASYDQIKAWCVAGLPCRVEVYQEWHALLVEHAKRCHRGAAGADPLLSAVVDPGAGQRRRGGVSGA